MGRSAGAGKRRKREGRGGQAGWAVRPGPEREKGVGFGPSRNRRGFSFF